MAWNKTETKSLGGSGGQVAHVGAPVAQNPGYAGKAYKDSWNIERAYKEGVRGVTWCFRACDAISANQAKLPMRLRLDNNPDGEIFKGKDPLLPILNSNASDTENAFAFRYRLSFQYLISTRGVFIEVMRNRAGEVTALGLLPPAYTAPIPDPKTFVSGYQIDIPGARSEVLQPNQVIWLRRPHPLDPYLSMTPLEAAGYAIESENLAKLYNRNFLLNDGRPGGLVVVNGQMDEDDKDELKARFRGNIARTGQVSVIASEGGAQFIDTAASPRDAAYIEMRDLSKDEILAAFGVPETVIGNASGRCLRASELVRLSDGTRVTAGSLVGKSFELMTSTPDGHVAVSAWATKEAIEPVYRITTETGRVLEVNGRHPLYTGEYLTTKQAHWHSANGPKINDAGWSPVTSLLTAPELGKWVVAVPTSIIPVSTNNLTTDEAFVLGALVGDGTMTGDGKPVVLSTPEGPFPKAFVAAVEALGDEVVHTSPTNRVDVWRVRARPENRLGSGQGARNSVRTRMLLRRVGLMGTTGRTKFVPNEIFGADRASAAAFLSGLFAADGCVHNGKPGGVKVGLGVTTISLISVSEDLVRGVQELLLRFGIQARLRFRENTSGGLAAMEGRLYSSWEVTISRSEDVLTFLHHVELPGKEAACLIAEERSLARQSHGHIPAWRGRDLNPDLGWEKVVSVKEVGVDQTVGIAVPGHHTYLSLLWEHNTFSNASEERLVFWEETMPSHLAPIERDVNILHDTKWVEFDTTNVPALVLARQQRFQYHMSEWGAGLTSNNEYRVDTGRKAVDSDLADSLLVNPALTPIGNTKKKFEPPPPLAPTAPGATPAPDAAAPVDPNAPGAPAAAPAAAPATAIQTTTATPSATADADVDLEVKRFADTDMDTKVTQVTERWTDILDRTVERFFERQQRVTMEKVAGKHSRKAIEAGTLEAGTLFDVGVWDRQLAEDIRPVFAAIIAEAAGIVAAKADTEADVADDPDLDAMIDAQVARVQRINETTKSEIAAAILLATDAPTTTDRHVALKAAVMALFVKALGGRRERIVDMEALGAMNGGAYLAGRRTGAASKIWVSKHDTHVRSAHKELDGQKVAIGEPFEVAGIPIRFPLDPLAPAALTIGCRCHLRFAA